MHSSAGGWRTILAYGALLAAGAAVLNWLEYQFVARIHPVELTLVLLAVVFLGLGVFLGARLFARAPRPAVFERNLPAQAALGVSERECEVLALLAAGCSNKEIAARMGVSPNTVKTHLANLFGKLEVSRRTQAILRARELGLLP